jgi:hypothetical protein
MGIRRPSAKNKGIANLMDSHKIERSPCGARMKIIAVGIEALATHRLLPPFAVKNRVDRGQNSGQTKIVICESLQDYTKKRASRVAHQTESRSNREKS